MQVSAAVSSNGKNVTLTWATVPGALGYVYYRDNTRISNTWDGTVTQATFGIPDTKQHIYTVQALSQLDSGTQTIPIPPVGPTGTTGTTGTTGPVGPLNPGYPAALQTLYGSYKPPAARTKTITTSAQLSQLKLVSGDDVLVKAGTYSGQFNLTGKLATGKIVARVTFEPGVMFTASSGTIANLNLDNLGGVLLEGPADLTNTNWSVVLINDSNDVIVKGLVAHNASTSGFYQGGDSAGSSNVWIVECEAYTNGHNSSAWNGYPTNYYLAGAHGIYYGGGGAQTTGGGIVGCYIHDQHVGYGVQFFGHTSGAKIDYCRFVNIDGKVSGPDSNLQTGTVSDRAGTGIEAYGDGVQNLTIGPNNTFTNCVYKNINVDGGAAVSGP